MTAVRVAGVRHGFGTGPDRVDVLDDLSFDVGPGEFVSLVGPSGCGKSTVLRLLAGLGTVDTGEVRLVDDGAQAGYMPQRDALLPWRRALANAVLGAEVRGVPRVEAAEAALALFEPFGLTGFERSWPSQLSGGMRQRLALLRTFLTPSDVLLLDEPFGALVAITRRQFQGWLEQVWMDDRRTVLFVTHDVEEAVFLADRVAVLSPRPGRVVAEIEVELDRPRDTTGPEFVAVKRRALEALGL